jgi:cytochrome P450
MLNEIDSVLGKRLATAEDVHRLQYTGQVIDESLRLHSPIHSISRVRQSLQFKRKQQVMS